MSVELIDNKLHIYYYVFVLMEYLVIFPKSLLVGTYIVQVNRMKYIYLYHT